MARIYPVKEGKVQTFLESQIATGESSIVSVANCILKFAKLTKIETKINMYLFPNKLATYSLQRFLVLCSVLNADVYRNIMLQKYTFVNAHWQENPGCAANLFSKCPRASRRFVYG